MCAACLRGRAIVEATNCKCQATCNRILLEPTAYSSSTLNELLKAKVQMGWQTCTESKEFFGLDALPGVDFTTQGNNFLRINVELCCWVFADQS